MSEPSQPSQPSQHFFHSQRLRLAYWAWGDERQRPVVLLHGGRDHARNWDRLAEALAADYRVVAPDLRGHGDSDWLVGGEYTLRQHVIDLMELIDRLGERVAVVAHSFGGLIATLTAGAYPERFAALAAIEGTGIWSAWSDGEITPDTLRKGAERFRALSGREPRVYPTLEEARDRMVEANRRLTPALAQHLATHGTRRVDGGYVWKFDNWARAEVRTHEVSAHEIRAFWRAIACPVLLLEGGESIGRRGSGVQEGDFQHARRVLVPDAGHWVHHDQFEIALREIRALLATAYPPDGPAA